jgi:hypothetical protein
MSILGSRVLILQCFRKLGEDELKMSKHDLQRRWTYLQVHAHRLHGEDIFRRLTSILFGCCQITEIELMISQGLNDNPLFVVLDEAQSLASSRKEYFITRGFNGAQTECSILKPLLKAWHLVTNVTVLVSGTGLSMDVIEKSVTSPQTPRPYWSVYTNVGAFLNKDVHAEYIRLRIWPDIPLDALDAAQRSLLDRAWRWLRGRFVYRILFCNRRLTQNLGTDLPPISSSF